MGLRPTLLSTPALFQVSPAVVREATARAPPAGPAKRGARHLYPAPPGRPPRRRSPRARLAGRQPPHGRPMATPPPPAGLPLVASPRGDLHGRARRGRRVPAVTSTSPRAPQRRASRPSRRATPPPFRLHPTDADLFGFDNGVRALPPRHWPPPCTPHARLDTGWPLAAVTSRRCRPTIGRRPTAGMAKAQVSGLWARKLAEPPVGFEPTTYALQVRCSSQLS